MNRRHVLRTFLITVIAVAFALLTSLPAWAKPFTGKYTGYYTNDTGGKGSDSMVLKESSNGEISGTWSGNIPVYGRRINPTTAELRGKTANRFYQITIKANGDGILAKYKATRLDSDGTYTGMCDFARE